MRIFRLLWNAVKKIRKSFLWKVLRLKKMLGYTNLDSEKGFAFFQRFLKEGGILEELEKQVSRKATQFVCMALILIIINKRYDK